MSAQSPFFPPGVPSAPGMSNDNSGAPSPFVHEEKPAFPIRQEDSYGTSIFGFLNPLFGPVASVFDTLSAKRKSLNLPHPGALEQIQREAKGTLLSNFFFDGARADLTKALSISPVFQITHAFAMGGTDPEGKMAPSSYSFNAVYGTERVFMQSGVDDIGRVTMRMNTRLAPGHITKVQGQFSKVAQSNFLQLEHDYLGSDHAANLKCINPNPLDGSGIYIVNYIQSLTRNFAVGLETIYQNQSADAQEAMMGYMAKWTSNDRNAIATCSVQGQGLLDATYWQRLSEKVDVAGNLHVGPVAGRMEANTALGAKYDYRMSTLRCQVDSQLRVSSQLETRLAPTFAFTVGGEIDHFRSAAKFGVGIAIESPSSDLPLDPNGPLPQPPSVPA